eukprot:1112425-Rhodomonas_salina.1
MQLEPADMETQRDRTSALLDVLDERLAEPLWRSAVEERDLGPVALAQEPARQGNARQQRDMHATETASVFCEVQENKTLEYLRRSFPVCVCLRLSASACVFPVSLSRLCCVLHLRVPHPKAQ